MLGESLGMERGNCSRVGRVDLGRAVPVGSVAFSVSWQAAKCAELNWGPGSRRERVPCVYGLVGVRAWPWGVQTVEHDFPPPTSVFDVAVLLMAHIRRKKLVA